MVPLVDLASADPTDALVGALAEVGFVQLVGHGLDPVVFAELRRAADAFFALDDVTKRAHVHPDPLANRGFRARGSEALAYSLGETTPPDLFESFNAGRELAEDEATGGNTSDLVQPTPWPDEHVPSYRPAIAAAFSEFERLGARLDTMIGRVIGQPDLAERSTRGPDMLACIDYRPAPDGTEVVDEGQLRMGAHSDYTTVTVLVADPVRGLQIVGPDGGWVDVVPEPDAVLVNVGDLLAMWTNDAWPSTLHRVVPMAAGAAARRRSVAWFHYPDPDVVVEPLPSWCVDRPARYEPVSVADHVRSKLAAPKTFDPSTGASTVNQRKI